MTIRSIAAAAALAGLAAGAAQAAHLPKDFKAVMNNGPAGTASPADGLALLSLDGPMGAATLSYDITISNALDFTGFGGGGAGGDAATAMHIHQAPPGMNGPVVLDLLADADSITATAGGTQISGVWTSAEGLDSIYAMIEFASGFTDFYVNLHSQTYAAGAIRGQIEAPADVPLPAAASFMALGLAAMGVAARRRKASAA
ncbi:CHRD domain-containing protein [Rhodovulum sp. DZ06]|uniref:CHRD domain-containing protein n=1 Tax=Rhodovulum sp. DZ06 TaxID=3425126 RepID=UPI003D34C4D3